MSTSITQIPSRIDRTIREPWQMRAMAIVDAGIVNVLILIAGWVVMGAYPVAAVSGDDQSIGFAQVTLVTTLVGVAAWGLLALLERATIRAAAIWTTIAVVVFLLSKRGPLASRVGTSSKIVLALMHVGGAATIIPLMLRSTRVRP